MIILGIDPGLNHTGYGLVEIKADKMRSLEYGCITNKINENYLEKIKKIHIEIEKLIKTYSPHEIVLEEIFLVKIHEVR